VRELFAAAYLLYPFYYDPLEKREASLREVIEAIRRRREGK
jgi:capsule polysaccharide export protein KpsC/LpsZ